jgi:hypothetical protein
MFEDQPYFQVGFMCMAGRPKEDHRGEPCRYSEVRAGCYDIDARIKAMDIGGIHASVNFPSGVTGFGGKLFSESKDQELGFACTQAWNDWLFEGWHLPHKDRIVRACAETGTVLNLHVSASGFPKMPPGAPMLELGATLFGPMAVSAYAEWLWRPWPVKFPELKPELKIAMSEAGIGWVAMLIDRVNNIMARSGYGDDWPDKKDSPSDRATPQFLVLHDRRSVDNIDTTHHWRRKHLIRVRRSPRRWHLARHPRRHEKRSGVAPRRRNPDDRP